MDTSKLVKCIVCGWVHFSVTQAYVDEWLSAWKVFWPTLDDKGKEAYGLKDGPPDTSEYLKCSLCRNSYTDFIDAEEEDIPYGSTIGPILERSKS